jgi:hypothetical protein
LLDEELAKLPEGAALPGEAAFKLYDTYGFPLDLTQDALREKSGEVDTDGFDAAMAEQKAKARAPGRARASRRRRDLVRPGRRARLDRVPRLRHRDRRGRGPGAGRAARGWNTAQGATGDHRREPDAVLCRGRRAGGRHRHAEDRDGAATITDTQKVAGVSCTSPR